jgi:hypothetical protein
MSFLTQLKAATQRHIKTLQRAHAMRVKEAERRAKLNLAHAKTKAEREKAMLSLRREKANLSQELSEAKIATQKAEAAAKRARIASGNLTMGEGLNKVGRQIGGGLRMMYKDLSKPAPRRRTTRRR